MSLDALAVAKTIAAYNRQVDDLAAALRECEKQFACLKGYQESLRSAPTGYQEIDCFYVPIDWSIGLTGYMDRLESALAHARKLLKESEGSK